MRLLGRALGVGERGETLAAYAEDLLTRVDAAVASMPEAQRPSVYLARGPQGLETGLKGSINTEIIERAGGRNVADPEDGPRGIANVSPERILLWHPDVIIRGTAISSPWSRSSPTACGKLFPRLPTSACIWLRLLHSAGSMAHPPLIGLAWLAHLFNGGRFAFDIAKDTRAFYKLFYQVDVSDADLAYVGGMGRRQATEPAKAIARGEV